jgi:tetratricopeptide (TPR) repeat protein
LAGQQSSRSGSYREAIQFFTQALALTDQVALDQRQLSQLNYLLGDAYWGLSDFAISRAAHIKALSLIGVTVPETPKQLLLHSIRPLLSHIWRHISHRRPPANNSEDWLSAAQSLQEITQGSYHDANFVLGLHCILNGLDIAERAGSSPEAVRLQVLYYCFLGFATGDVGLHPVARIYMNLAEKGLQKEPHPEILAWFNFINGSYLASRGAWDLCNPRLNEAIRMSRTIDNLGLWVEASEFSINSLYLQSRFSESLALTENAMQVAVRDGHFQAVGMLHTAKARLLFVQGKTDEARKHYFDNEAAITASFTEETQTVGKITALALLIDFDIRAEAWESALKSAETLNNLVTNAQTISFMFAGEASASISLYLTLWEKQSSSSYRLLAHSALKRFNRKYARRYPMGHSVEAMYRCWYHGLNGNEKAARKAGALAIHEAQVYKMPYYEALAHYHLGRFMPKSDPERTDHLKIAIAIFDDLGAAHDARRARQDLT